MLRHPMCVLLLLLGLSTAARPGASPVWPPPEQVLLSDEELLLGDPYSGHFRSRFWYFNILLGNGTALTCSQFQWRYGLLGGSGLFLLSAPPDGEPFVLETRIDSHDLEEAQDRLLVRFGGSLIEGSRAGARLRLELPDFSCDLAVRNLLEPWKPGDGYTWYDAKRTAYSRHAVTTPFGEVSGRLAVRGQEQPVSGWCYADRGVLSIPVSRLSPEGFSFRVFGAGEEGQPWMVSLLTSTTARSYGSRRVGTLLAARGGQWLLAAPEFSFEAQDFREESGIPFAYPRRLVIRGGGEGGRVEGAFTVTRLTYLNDILARLPPLFRQVAEALIRRPVIYRLAGTFEGSFEAPDGTRQTLLLPGQGEYNLYR